MIKKSTGFLIATIIWSFVVILELLNQNFDVIVTMDYVTHGMHIVALLAFLFAYYKTRKDERVYG